MVRPTGLSRGASEDPNMPKCLDVLELQMLENVWNQDFEKFRQSVLRDFAKLQDWGGSHSFHLSENSVSESKMTMIERVSETESNIEYVEHSMKSNKDEGKLLCNCVAAEKSEMIEEPITSVERQSAQRANLRLPSKHPNSDPPQKPQKSYLSIKAVIKALRLMPLLKDEEILVVLLPPPKPPDFVKPFMALSWQGHHPKPPDDYLCATIVTSTKPPLQKLPDWSPEMTEDAEINSRPPSEPPNTGLRAVARPQPRTTSMKRLAARMRCRPIEHIDYTSVGNVLEKLGANCLLRREFTSWVEAELRDLSQFTNNIWVQDKEVLDGQIHVLIPLGLLQDTSDPKHKLNNDAQFFNGKRFNGYDGVATYSLTNFLYSFPFLDAIALATTPITSKMVKFKSRSHYFVFFIVTIYGSILVSENFMRGMLLYSSALVTPWDPGKFNVVIATSAYELYWRNSNIIYNFPKFVYDIRKIWSSSCGVQLSLLDLLSVRSNSVSTCASKELKDLLAARRVMETTFNLEDKVIIRGWHL